MDFIFKYKEGKDKPEKIERVMELYKLGHRFVAPIANGWSPNIDIYSIEDQLYVKVDVAGISIDDIKISYYDKVLTISGKRLDTDRRRKKKFYQMEIDYGKFLRRIKFPFQLEADKAEADYEDGFLTIKFNIITDEEKRIKLE
jgi:HSP20 family protein